MMNMNKKYVITATIAVILFAILGISLRGCWYFGTQTDTRPDVLSPINSSYITDISETSVTLEGYITTPADENPMPEDIDDPEYLPPAPEEMVTYIYKSHTSEFAEDGALNIIVEYKKVKGLGYSQEFSITVEDEKLTSCNEIYLSCNGHTHKVWQR